MKSPLKENLLFMLAPRAPSPFETPMNITMTRKIFDVCKLSKLCIWNCPKCTPMNPLALEIAR